jgi:hypothetical protein
MAHMWLLAPSVPAAGASPGGDALIAGGRPFGDPTVAGQPVETIAFSAPAPGTYLPRPRDARHAGTVSGLELVSSNITRSPAVAWSTTAN